jgi:hypothetical protein
MAFLFTQSDMDTPMKVMLNKAGPFMRDTEYEKTRNVVKKWLKLADDDDDLMLGDFLANTSVSHEMVARFLMELDMMNCDLEAPLSDYIRDNYPHYKGNNLIEMYASDDIDKLGLKLFENPM